MFRRLYFHTFVSDLFLGTGHQLSVCFLCCGHGYPQVAGFEVRDTGLVRKVANVTALVLGVRFGLPVGAVEAYPAFSVLPHFGSFLETSKGSGLAD